MGHHDVVLDIRGVGLKTNFFCASIDLSQILIWTPAQSLEYS